MAADSHRPVTFAAAGWHHPHLHMIVAELLAAGARLVGVADADPELAELASEIWGAPLLKIDESVEPGVADLLATADRPDRRAHLAATAMRSGMDVLIDKPAAIDADQLRLLIATQSDTGRRCLVHCSERVSSRATMAAIELVAAGRVGRVVSVECTAPHLVGDPADRPDWFWHPASSGGILADLGAHQTDQFLAIAAADAASRNEAPPIASVEWARTARVGDLGTAASALSGRNAFEHQGVMVMRAGQVTGYSRLDWWTPDGLGSWGDGRLTIVGTDATIEVRKNVDPGGQPGADHLIVTDGEGVVRRDCAPDDLGWIRQFIADIAGGVGRPDQQASAFRSVELALDAQELARRTVSQ